MLRSPTVTFGLVLLLWLSPPAWSNPAKQVPPTRAQQTERIEASLRHMTKVGRDQRSREFLDLARQIQTWNQSLDLTPKAAAPRDKNKQMRDRRWSYRVEWMFLIIEKSQLPIDCPGLPPRLITSEFPNQDSPEPAQFSDALNYGLRAAKLLCAD